MRRNRNKTRKRLFQRRWQRKQTVLENASVKKEDSEVKREASVEKGNTGMDVRFAVAAADFAVSMLKESYEAGENVLISPISVESALLMAANGANGTTLEEYRKLFGGEMSMEELKKALNSELDRLLPGNA